MACVLVHTEVDDGHPTPAAGAVLGEARRIASTLGATVYALAWVPPGDDEGPAADALTTVLGRGGADRVVLVAAPPTPRLWLTRGQALAQACAQLRPALTIFASDDGGRDLAPRLAARLGAAYVAEPVIETGPRGEVVLARPVYDGEQWRRLQLDELEHPTVVTLSGDRSLACGADEAERVRLDLPPASVAPPTTERDDPHAALAHARVVVVAGGGVTTTTLPLVAALAAQLGGELAGTQAACQRGLIDPERQVGVGARSVTPALYVVVGASGSAAHLGAVSPDAEIVAVDRDPRAPIWKAARWGLVGQIEALVPALTAALGGRA
ncbi:MAG: FAD-binding protein [Kofleriaceae bacterium]